MCAWEETPPEMPDASSSAPAPELDKRAFRDALGSFVTGVTIVTTRGEEGGDIGLTANSFNSVSLDPPMVLWSLALSSSSLPAFRRAPWWAVHILASEQADLSARFAQRGIDKFAGLAVSRGPGDIPLLDGCAARFICRGAYEYEGGDHAIFVGEVLEFDREGRAPLVYHQGRYAGVVHGGDLSEAAGGTADGHFLGHLLGRAHAAALADVRREYRRRGLSDAEYALLTVLGLGEGCAVDELLEAAGAAGVERSAAALAAAAAHGLIDMQGGHARLTEAGRHQAVELMAVAGASQIRIEGRLATGEMATLRHLLRRVVGEG
jgi:3-hydroxy-9,10-secoandrosta-1,3,5(10)-triene-9,17-dione monooxygenase reductase component